MEASRRLSRLFSQYFRNILKGPLLKYLPQQKVLKIPVMF